MKLDSENYHNIVISKMDDLCSACLCSGRKLQYIGDTGFYHFYSQILKEIAVPDFSDICINVCWECKALLRRFSEFKDLVKKSYTALLQKVDKNEPSSKWSLERPPRLQEKTLDSFCWPEPSVKVEMIDELDLEVLECKPLKEEPTYSEPEPQAFVSVESIQPTKTEKARKVVLFVKPHDVVKERTKKNPKPPKKKLVAKKINTKKKVEDSDSDDSDQFISEYICDRDNKLKEKEEEMLTEDKETELIVQIKCEDETPVELENKKPPKQRTQPLEKKDKKKRVRVPEPELVGGKPKCGECGKIFSSRKTYRFHINVIHKGLNHNPCSRCGKVYQWKSNLDRHMRTHRARDKGELYCATCDIMFASVGTYRQHLRTSKRHVSESEFSFACNDCGKKFANKTKLQDHVDWEHLNNIKYRCQLCGNKPFKSQTSLYLHTQNVHGSNKKRDNLCHVCGKCFPNNARLNYHIVAMHTSETPYKCGQCAAAFGWRSSLYTHVKEVHYKIKVHRKKIRKSKKPNEPI